jgi:CO/xanthine dehydrogenase FAD-binding subunit
MKFEVYVPRNERDLLTFLSKRKGAARIIAGGTSIIPDIRTRKTSPICLVDASHLSNLRYIKHQRDRVRIGALSRIQDLKSKILKKTGCKAFEQVAGNFGGTAIANMATVGGNLAVGSSSSDLVPVFLSLEANVRLKSSIGEREIRLEDFMLEKSKTDRKPPELIAEINFQLPARGKKISLFRKIGRRSSTFLAFLSLATFLLVDNAGVIKEARLAFNQVRSGTPGRARNVENELGGRNLNETTIEQAVAKLPLDISNPFHRQADAEYWNLASRNLLEDQLRRCIAELS